MLGTLSPLVAAQKPGTLSAILNLRAGGSSARRAHASLMGGPAFLREGDLGVRCVSPAAPVSRLCGCTQVAAPAPWGLPGDGGREASRSLAPSDPWQLADSWVSGHYRKWLAGSSPGTYQRPTGNGPESLPEIAHRHTVGFDLGGSREVIR